VLVVIRFTVFMTAIILAGILPKKLARTFTSLLAAKAMGVMLSVRNKHLVYSEKAPIVAGNHVSDMDLFCVPSVRPYRPVVSTRVGEIPMIGKLLHYAYSAWDPFWVPAKVEGVDVRAKLRDEVQKNANQNERENFPIAILPEGGLTNGSGLMLFKRFIFSLGLPVQPIAIKYDTTLWSINPDWLGTRWIYNLLWVMFIPYHRVTITYLPKTDPLPDEAPEAFAKRVQEIIAKELKIPATDYTYEDKVKLRVNLYGGKA